MSIGGHGGINMSNGLNGRQMSIGGPGGINMYNGPNGNSMSIGGPGGINYTNYGGGGDSDDDDWDISGAIVKDPWDWPYGISINSNNVINNFANQGNNYGNVVYGNGGVYGGPFGFNGFPGPYGNNWGSIPQSQWPPHVLAQYQQGMAEGARGLAEGAREMERAAEEMSNMGMGTGMGPWGMNAGMKKNKKKKGKK
jgi:hypothetical protein